MSKKNKILAGKLKQRLEICDPVQTVNDNGGFDRTYNVLTTVWAGIHEISEFSRYIRGQQVEEGRRIQDTDTHEFIVRYEAIKNLGAEFSSGYGTGFTSMAKLMPVQVQHFLRLNTTSVKKRLFRVTGLKRDDDCKAFFIIRAIEIEEQGTGWQT
jgi:head-tail adaptor